MEAQGAAIVTSHTLSFEEAALFSTHTRPCSTNSILCLQASGHLFPLSYEREQASIMLSIFLVGFLRSPRVIRV